MLEDLIRRALLVASLLFVAVPAAATPISVLVIGDSITAGNVSEPSGDPYVELLASELGSGFAVTNIGLDGASTKNWALGTPGLPKTWDYVHRVAPKLPAAIVAILLGTNDATGFLLPEPTTPALYGLRLSTLVDQLFDDGAQKVVLMSPPPMPAELDAAIVGRLLDYQAEVFSLCSIGGAVFCGPDVHTLLGADDFEPGNVHPNATGHAKIAAALSDSILMVVPEPGSGLLTAVGLVMLAASRRRRQRR